MFIHNFGHAAVAYLGYKYHPSMTFLWEVLLDNPLRMLIREAMQQSATALQYAYPGEFSTTHLQEHIDELLQRFSNRSLGDTVFRVGCDLPRKLAFDDRIITPLLSTYGNGLPYDKIAKVLVAALEFKGTDRSGEMYPRDIEFHHQLEEHGILHMLEKVGGLTQYEVIEILS